MDSSINMDDEVEIILQQDQVEVTEPLVADYILPTASASTLGGVKIGSNVSVDVDGTISIPTASADTKGVIRIGSGLTVDSNGVVSASGSSYVLPEATKTTLGGVYVDDELSTSSTHPVQNAVVSLALADATDDISDLSTDVDNLSTGLGNLSTTVGNLSTTVGNLSTAVSNNTNSIGVNAGNISSLTTRMTNAEGDITALTNGANEMSGNLQALATSVLYQKKLSIYGDSISTFAGYIPTGNATYYTGSNAGVTSVDDTWWKKVDDALGLELLVNNSWSGRAVSSIRDSQTGHTTDAGYKQANIDVLGSEGDPDIIIIKLGINDFNQGALLGTYDGSTALPNDPTNFTDAYAMMLDRIMTTYPLADVYCCTLVQCERTGSAGFPETNSNGDSLIEWNEAIRKLAEAFGCKILNHASCGITYYNLSEYTGDYDSETGKGLHPNAEGMSLIANQTIHEMDNTIRIRY